MSDDLAVLIAEFNCDIAGMVAENMQRSQAGESMSYTDDDFFNLKKEFRANFNSLKLKANHE